MELSRLMKVFIASLVIALVIFYLFSQYKNNQKAKANSEQGKAFLAANIQNEEVMETLSGLQYQILNRSENTEKPKQTDKVNVHYHGTLIDGTVFDSSVERGDPISFPLNRVIKGWTEGLQLMSVGDKFRFFIPSNLAYGSRNVGKIAGGSVLIFDVELLAINP